MGILGVLGVLIFQVKIFTFTFLSQNLEVYLNLLELLLFRNGYHNQCLGDIYRPMAQSPCRPTRALVVFLCPVQGW